MFIYLTKSTYKIMKNDFYFKEDALFVLEIFKILYLSFSLSPLPLPVIAEFITEVDLR